MSSNLWCLSTIFTTTVLMLVLIATDPTGAATVEESEAAASPSPPLAVPVPAEEFDDSDLIFARERGIKFYVQAKRMAALYEVKSLESLSTAKYWDSSAPLIVLIHGWMEQATPDSWRPRAFEPLQEVKDAYLDMKRADNVLLIGWSRYAKDFYTKEAERGALIAGNATGRFIWNLKNSGLLGANPKDYKSVHLIGFGMGATVAGVAGYTIQRLSFNKVGRITGLDPPLPNDSLPMKDQLDISDALFVDNIHCSLTPHSYQRPANDITSYAFGHVDFYPGGGIWQDGCMPLIHFLDISFISGTCSHLKCPYLYAKTIRGSKYHGCSCKDYDAFHYKDCACRKTGPLMGEFCDEEARGIYFIDTNEDQSTRAQGTIVSINADDDNEV